MTTTLTAPALARVLRGLGYRGMSSDRNREGIRVQSSGRRYRVSVCVDYDSDARAQHTAGEIARDLRAQGYTVTQRGAALTVERGA